MDVFNTLGAQHASALLQMLAEQHGKCIVLHVLEVSDDKAQCEGLWPDGSGELVDVNFGFEGADVHFTRTTNMGEWNTSQLGAGVEMGMVYVLGVATDNDKLIAVHLDEGVLLGAASAPEESKTAARDAYIARRKRTT